MPDATWNLILPAVANLMRQVEGLPEPFVRKAGVLLEEADFKKVYGQGPEFLKDWTLWYVCPGGEEVPVEYTFVGASGTGTNQVHWEYPVWVLAVRPHNRDFTLPANWLRLREQIRGILDQRGLPGAPTVIDAELKPFAPFSHTDEKTVYDISGVAVSYMSWETRTQ